MTSNIRIQKVCEYCGKDFEARKTTSKTCSDHCAKMYYKQRKRAAKIEETNKATILIKTKPIEEIKAKAFLTVQDVATLLNCSIRSVYYQIESGKIKAVNLGKRLTRVKRSELDKLFE